MKYTRKKLEEYEFELKKLIPMMQFVSILREKMQLQRQMFGLVFGADLKHSIAKELREQQLGESLDQVKNYNCLKQVVDNCSFEIEIGEDGLIKQK
jgi:hypothetical protein